MTSLAAARLQMTVSLAFHMVFAAVGIGLPLLVVIAEGLHLRTGQKHYLSLTRRWAKVMGLLFAVGAVSGTVLSFELGLLWPRYMELLGPVVGHIFGLEGYAFFLEAIFIGLYLYGWNRLHPVAHWWCGVVIAISGMLSGVFVLGVNAWMQVPVGFELAGGRVAVSDPIAIFKHPLWAYMAWHSTLACYLAVAFGVAGWYAWRLLDNSRLRGKKADTYERSAIMIAMAIGGTCALLQPLSGDSLAKYVFQTQPVKFAAMEGQFQTQRYAPLRIGGWPDEDAGMTRFAIEIPGGLSFLATRDPAAEVPGLDQVAKSDRPNVGLTHLAFQVMVASGVALALVAIWFWLAYARAGSAVFDHRTLLWALAVAGPVGFVGLEAGWFVTEAGRQPWIIHGVMRTRDAVTPEAGVAPLFFAFSALYFLLAVTVVVLLRQLAARPIDDTTSAEHGA